MIMKCVRLGMSCVWGGMIIYNHVYHMQIQSCHVSHDDIFQALSLIFGGVTGEIEGRRIWEQYIIVRRRVEGTTRFRRQRAPGCSIRA